MLLHYIRVAARNLLKHKANTAINVLGLAVGMMCCLFIVLFVRDELSYDRYHANADRIYRIVESGNAQTVSNLAPTMRDNLPEVENFVRLRGTAGIWMMNYEDKTFYERQVGWSDGSLFDIFSFRMIQGDPATALMAPFSVVITESTARKYFGDEDPMGKVIKADGSYAQLSVTGVIEDMPAQSHLVMDFIVSLSTAPKVWGSGDWALANWQIRQFYTYVMLAPGADIATVVPKIPGLLTAHGDEVGSKLKPEFQPLTDIHLYSHMENELGINSDIGYVYIMSAVAMLVLVIASLNFVNLSTARSMLRAREVGIRKVVGAQQTQIVRQFLGESVVVALCALGFALAAVWLLTPALEIVSGRALDTFLLFDRIGLIQIGGTIVLTGLLAGMYPALILSSLRPVFVLKGGKMGSSRQFLRKVLVAVQLVITIVLMIGTYLIEGQLHFVQNERFGLSKEQVLIIPGGMEEVYVQMPVLKERFLQSPDILNVATGSSMPARSAGTGGLFTNSARITDQTDARDISLSILQVGFDYIETLDMELLAGRGPSPDFPGDIFSVVLNEAAVKELGWASPQEAVGKKVTLNGEFDDLITGVVRDFQMYSLRDRISPMALMKGRRDDGFMAIKMRTQDLPAVIGYIEGVWDELLPDFPLVYTFLADDFEQLYRSEQNLSAVCRIFTVLTVFIACLGLYGLSAFSAEQRAREIGIRKVLGASTPGLVRLLTGELLVLGVVASVVAWPLAYLAMDEWLQQFAYRIQIEAWPFVWSGALVLLITMVTVGLHAYRRATGNPIDALRYE